MPGEAPDPIAEAIKVLAAADKAAVSAALRVGAPGHWQGIFQEGHNIGYGKGHGDLTAAQSTIADLTAKLATANQQLADARSGGPVDVNKLHADYKAQLEQKDAAAKTRETELLGRLETQTLASTKAALRSELEHLGIHPKFATVLSEDPEVRKRLKVSEDKPVVVLQEGTEIPLAAPAGSTPIKALAAELHGKADPLFIVSKVDNGAGKTGNEGGPSGLDAKPEAKVLDDIRTNKRAELDAQAAARDKAVKAAQELGLGPAVPV